MDLSDAIDLLHPAFLMFLFTAIATPVPSFNLNYLKVCKYSKLSSKCPLSQLVSLVCVLNQIYKTKSKIIHKCLFSTSKISIFVIYLFIDCVSAKISNKPTRLSLPLLSLLSSLEHKSENLI